MRFEAEEKYLGHEAACSALRYTWVMQQHAGHRRISGTCSSIKGIDRYLGHAAACRVFKDIWDM